MAKYAIVPSNEPDGEGNGWVDCPEDNATAFIIWDTDTDQIVECYDSREQAEKWVNTRS